MTRKLKSHTICLFVGECTGQQKGRSRPVAHLACAHSTISRVIRPLREQGQFYVQNDLRNWMIKAHREFIHTSHPPGFWFKEGTSQSSLSESSGLHGGSLNQSFCESLRSVSDKIAISRNRVSSLRASGDFYRSSTCANRSHLSFIIFPVNNRRGIAWSVKGNGILVPIRRIILIKLKIWEHLKESFYSI